MMLDFTGKRVIVTGGTRGIGKDIVELFHSLGAHVIATGTDRKRVESLNQACRGDERMKYVRLDLRDDRSVAKFISGMKKIGRIDVCVNNAGINKIDHIDRVRVDDWDEIVRVNLRGPFMVTKEIGALMRKRRSGRIVNVASIFGVITREKRAAYTASKSGLIGLTRTASIDFARFNILVNAVSPGFVVTDLTRRMLSDSEMDILKMAIPLKRFATGNDIARVVVFLASDLNTYITGQNIIVDGGYVNI